MQEKQIKKETNRILKDSKKEFLWKLLTSIGIRGLSLITPMLYSNRLMKYQKTALEKHNQELILKQLHKLKEAHTILVCLVKMILLLIVI